MYYIYILKCEGDLLYTGITTDVSRRMDEHFGKSYYEQVKGESDYLIDATFYLMGEDSNGNENVIVNGYKIVFAEKDGRYYTFG